MTEFDYAFLGLLCLSVLLGVWRGLVSEVFSLLGWVVALGLAWQGAAPLAPAFAGVIANAAWMGWPLAFITIFIVLLVVLAMVRWFLRKLLEAAGLSPVDRILGACFGVARALIIALLVVAGAGMSKLPKQPWWSESTFAPPLETAVIAIKPMFPKELGQRIKY